MKILPMHRLWIVLVLLVAAILLRVFLGIQLSQYNTQIESVPLEGAPYAKYVKVAPGASMFFTWGITASPRSKVIARESLEDDDRYGDTYTQAHRVMTTLTSDLDEVGLTLRDVVNVRAYVVGDEESPPDFDGWNRAFMEFFGTQDNPHQPARTTVGISRLFISQYKIEVEFIAVFPEGRGPFVEGSRHWLDYERSGRVAEETHPIWKSYGRSHFPMSTGKVVDSGQALFFGSAVMGDTKFKMPPGMPVNPMMYGKVPDQAKSILTKTAAALK
ncbi:MAG: Rid family hydrolase, partial [Verrucomicrobiota bacterium]